MSAVNHAAVRLFLSLGTQWRCNSTGLQGLDYPSTLAAAHWLQLTPEPDLFARLRVLEAEVLRCWRERENAHG